MSVCLIIIGCTQNNNQGRNGLSESISPSGQSTPLDSLSREIEKEQLYPEILIENIQTGTSFKLQEIDLINKVICYISEIHCTQCIEQELSLLQEIYTKEQTVVLCDFRSLRNLKIYFQLNDISLNAYIIRSNMPQNIRNLTNPTFFKVGKDLNLSSVFFASFGERDRSIGYHTHMKSLIEH